MRRQRTVFSLDKATLTWSSIQLGLWLMVWNAGFFTLAAILASVFPAVSPTITTLALMLAFGLYIIATISMIGLSFRQGVLFVEMNLAIAFAIGLWPALCLWLGTLFGGLKTANPSLAADILETGAWGSGVFLLGALMAAICGRVIGNDGP